MWCGQEGARRTPSADPTLRKGIQPPPGPPHCMYAYASYVNQVFKVHTYVFFHVGSRLLLWLFFCVITNKQQPQCQCLLQTSTLEKPDFFLRPKFPSGFLRSCFYGSAVSHGPWCISQSGDLLPLRTMWNWTRVGGRTAGVKTSDTLGLGLSLLLGSRVDGVCGLTWTTLPADTVLLPITLLSPSCNFLANQLPCL